MQLQDECFSSSKNKSFANEQVYVVVGNEFHLIIKAGL